MTAETKKQMPRFWKYGELLRNLSCSSVCKYLNTDVVNAGQCFIKSLSQCKMNTSLSFRPISSETFCMQMNHYFTFADVVI